MAVIYQTVQVQAINHHFTCAQGRLLTRKIEQRVARTAISPAGTEPTGAFGRVDRRSVTDFWSKRILSARSDGARRKSRLPARICPASAGETGNRGSPVLRTTNGENRCCADSGEARQRRKEARHLAASRREQSSPRRRRRGMAAMRIGYEASRRFARDRSSFRSPLGGIRLCCKERGRVLRVHFETPGPLRRRSSSPRAARLPGASPLLRMRPTARLPHRLPQPAFGNSPARSPAPACFVTTHKKRGTPTFPLRARDASGHRRRFA
ncbi:hypothetical protein AWB71_01721 [Caballeronia peredens]|nr:hypothetical protein AWB71_01721 [Caballeronia peredens]